MDIRTQSALLAAIVGMAIGASMLLRPQRPRVITLFGIFALSVGTFYLSQALESLFPLTSSWPTVGRIVLGVTLALGSILPFTALGFFLEFLSFGPRAARYGRRVSLLSLGLGVIVGATPLAEQTWARAAVAAWVLLALSFSVSLLLSRMRVSESRIDRARLAYLAIGAGLAILFAGIDFLPRFGLPFPTLGPIIATLYLFFLSQTLLRLRLMDLHELFGKTVAQTVLAVILALVFVVLTAWVGPDGKLFVFNTIVAAFVMLILLEPLRAKVDERVVAIFFRERFDFLQSIRALQARSTNVIDVNELATLVLDTLNETRRVTHASIYLLAEDRPGFRLLDSRGPQPAVFIDAGSSRVLVSRTEKAQLLEAVERRMTELKSQPAIEARRSRDEVKRLTDVKAAMQLMKAAITVPLLGNDRVIGFLNLWDERVPEAFASDEIALILELAEQLAGVVENSKLYEKMRERDRLAALGEMSAGLAHEIRNPLGAIKGAAQCLDPQRVSTEDAEFLEVIVEEVNRLNGVVTAFLDYARPMKQNFGPTDLNEVITRTMRLIQNDVPTTLLLRTELSEGLPKVDADAEQLKQVLINLVQNARQALAGRTGEITLRTLKSERFGEPRFSQEHVELHVIDNGPGIPSDQQLNIFVPFFTTKQKGTGLGLAICQRIVKNHGGTITVQSRVGEGSTFIIRLPALPSELPGDSLIPDGTPLPNQSLANLVSPEDSQTGTKKKKRRAG